VAYVKDGEIVLNISPNAVRNLDMGNDMIACSGRFGGVVHEIFVPVSAVIGIFAKETGQGLVFQPIEPGPAEPPTAPKAAKPQLKIVK
jgi:stringent starvation protein B